MISSFPQQGGSVSNSTNRHQELKALPDLLKLVGMAKYFPELALRAAKEGLSHKAYLHELARQEEAIRQEHSKGSRATGTEILCWRSE
jgi:hypothetical protein